MQVSANLGCTKGWFNSWLPYIPSIFSKICGKTREKSYLAESLLYSSFSPGREGGGGGNLYSQFPVGKSCCTTPDIHTIKITFQFISIEKKTTNRLKPIKLHNQLLNIIKCPLSQTLIRLHKLRNNLEVYTI